MKILAIHNFHRKGSASGDDQVFVAETSLLESYGHDVIRYSVCNDEFDSLGYICKLKSILGMFWSWKNYRNVQNLIKRNQPDVVHVHTFFPLLSPSILYAAKRLNVPVIATLHDTRFICPCATSLRDSKLCNDCGDGKFFRMCKFGCFKGSRTKSFILACIFKYHRFRRTFYKQIDKYICLNDEQIYLLEQIGFDRKKISKKYNFVPDYCQNICEYKIEGIPERYVVFYGRIGVEKGILFLMNAWNDISNIPLVVMGGGPLEDVLKSWAKTKNNVFYLGYTEHNKCLHIVKNAEFVVFPSIWYEGCSMVEIETMSLGKAIIATDLGFSKEAIVDGYNGYKFPLGSYEDFIMKITYLWNDSIKLLELGNNSRKEYESKYGPQKNYQLLLGIYESFFR